MTHRISEKNWSTELAKILRESHDGDLILVATPSQKVLAERAKQRLCPQKRITIQTEV